MRKLTGACIIGQSGGPTSVINASALGAFEAALDAPEITRVLGAAHGIRGVIDDVLYDIGQEDREELRHLLYTPSSALGSCRYKIKDPAVDDSDYRRILEIFKKYDVRYFFYNGGNDSMDTCNKISKFMLANNYECRVMGIPKTIDNDLTGTDHCPGFGSAAKYVATTFMEVSLDARVYDYGMITIIEVMGRNAGWLTAATALASTKGLGPDLIYLPELAFDIDTFVDEVAAVYGKTGKCLVAVSEGIKDKEGHLISDNSRLMAADGFGHAQLGGLAAMLSAAVRKKTGAQKVRGIEMSLLQRCASHLASATDIAESYAAGKAAVEGALAGITDKMAGFVCDRTNGYKCEIKLFDLEEVANTEKKIPSEWITPDGRGVTQAYIDYALPLIQGETGQAKEDGLPRFARLKKIRV